MKQTPNPTLITETIDAEKEVEVPLLPPSQLPAPMKPIIMAEKAHP